jgi:hypothetical protein
MTRRLLLALFGAAPPAPTDLDDLRHFATQYNRYVLSLRDGHLDLRQWARVAAAWNQLTNR